MENQARLVIIGAGIVGCAAAYHLTKLGWKDIVVLDQGKRPFYGGSSTHAPGGMFQTNPSKLMCELAQYGVKLYQSLNYEGKSGAELVGGIELARTPERLMELKRRCSIGRSWGLEGVMLSPKECAERIPILDDSRVLGGLYVPDDGVGRPVHCVMAFAEYVIQQGSTKFYDEVDVQGFQVENKSIKAVVTSKGTINCEHVLCCAGMWGPVIADLIGQPIPLQPMEHQYSKTSDLEALKPFAHDEIVLPLIRDQDHSSYFRQHDQQFGLGNYYHRSLPMSAHDLLHPTKAPEMPSVRDWTQQDFEALWQRSSELFPCLAQEKPDLVYKINGVFSFTPDSGSFIGESTSIKGFWMAEAVWYLHAAGFSKIIAEWMDAGEPQQDVHEADMNRFYKHFGSKKYVYNRGSEQYRVVYDVNHPKRQSLFSRGLCRSPVYDRLKHHHGAVFFETMGFERAQWHESNSDLLDLNFAKRWPFAERNWSPIEGAEALHVRNKVALFDLSAFQIIEVTGKGAMPFLQNNTCSNMDTKVGKIAYSHVTSENGGIKSDITVARMDDDVFWMITGVGSFGHDYACLKQRQENRNDVQLRSIGAEYSTIGLWGPKARAVLQPICDINLEISDFRFFTWKEAFVDEIPVYLFRLSYVGESGWEIYTQNHYAAALWEKLELAGKPYDIRPVGMGAFDSLRIEKSYRSWGGDMAQNETPFHAGTDFVINWKKGDFVGKAALEKIRDKGVDLRLHTFKIHNKSAIMMGSEGVYNSNGQLIGYVTSGNYGYSVDESIGFAYIPPEYGEAGTILSFDHICQRYSGEVCADILYDPKYDKIRL
mgnify:CR=1 FL=1